MPREFPGALQHSLWAFYKVFENGLDTVKDGDAGCAVYPNVHRQSAVTDFAAYQPLSGTVDYMNMGANTNATIVINFIKMFKEGPEVSLKGSPTVSPLTAAA